MPQDGATFEVRAIEVLRRVEAGEIVTYGEVVAEAGSPGAGRAVGNTSRVPVMTSPGGVWSRRRAGWFRVTNARTPPGCDGRACPSSAGASDSGRAGRTTCPR